MVKLSDYPIFRYYIEFKGIETPEELHAYLRDTLVIPPYNGNNLDALYDYLTSLNLVGIALYDMDCLMALGEYGQRTAEVFREAAEQNRFMEFRIFNRDDDSEHNSES